MRLTDKDKRVFYGLVKWPELNDIELSEKTGVVRSTVTAVRRKLERGGYYKTIRVPNFAKIGCELLSVKFGQYNPLIPYEERAKFFTGEPKVFFRLVSDSHRVSIMAARDFTEVKEYIDRYTRIYAEHDFLPEGQTKYEFFSLRLTKLFSLLDFTPLLNRLFDMKDKINVDLGGSALDSPPLELSENDRLVYYCMVKYPTFRDKDISDKTGLKRQTVNNIRKKLESNKMLWTVRVPDLEKLGCELIVFAHIKHNPRVTMEQRMEGIRSLVNMSSIFFILGQNLETVIFGASRSYTEMHEEFNIIVNFYKEKYGFEMEPQIMLFPLKEVKLFMYDRYAPLVKELLGIKKDM